MITPTEENKLHQAVLRIRESAEAIRQAEMAIGIALSDLEMDCSICGQFVPSVEAAATKLRMEATAMRKRLNGLDPASVWLQGNRLAEAAWENRLEPPTPQNKP